MKSIFLLLSLMEALACSTGEKASDAGDLNSKSKDTAEEAPVAKEPEPSANRVTFTSSLTNNPLTSHTVNMSKAEDQVAKFMEGKSKVQLESKVSAERLARKSLGQVLAAAKKIAELEMTKSAGNTAPEAVQLELALAAINSKNYGFAEYFLQNLTESKNPKIRAAAFNAVGVVALRDDRVPEAVLYFRQALKVVPNYRPALLNLGFAALKGGDLESAKKSLSDMQNDWFVQYGLISVARMEGNESLAGSFCDKVLKKEPQHKGALFNCALYEFQNKRNFAKARDLSSKAASAKHGDVAWDEKAMQLTNMIDNEEAVVKRAQAEKKAAEKAPPKQDSKAAPKAGGPAAP